PPPAGPPRAPATHRTGRPGAGSRVYVGNLSWHTSWQSLKDHFRQAGEVVHADVMQHDGRSKGCGIVAFATAQEAANAIATLGETELDGRTIFVREDREEAAP
ncbi:RNA binding protein-like protein, partial [Emiliania huxleyi CCMP1516]|uniref:RRM domain-containing protein n=2 Tax=Emiliania huxleyi TaxID=2903 RepID=A0A0D3KCH9_EMIH1